VTSIEAEGTVPADVRRQRIADAIGRRGFVRVADLSTAFHVSDVTVRTDLDALDRVGVVRRVHGGAVLRTPFARELSFEEALESSGEEKRRIARAAVELMVPGTCVFVDVGTTTAAFARALAEREDLAGLTLVTNGLSIARELESSIPRNSVVVTGGTLRPLQHSLVAPLASLVLDRLRVDVAVIGCSGVDARAGVTNVNLEEAELKRLMVERSGRAIVLADGSKLGRADLARVAGVDEISVLVTSSSADTAALSDLRAAGLEVEIS
jgi:DeoR family transcriptional regulator of aga operon